MDDRALLNEPGGGLKPTHSNGGAVAAWLAECGMVALLPTEESDATDDQPPRQPDPASTQESAQSDPHNQPEVAVLIRLSAQKLWSEGRANPLDWVCRSWVGNWQTDDRVTWRTTDGVWLAPLHRSPNGRRVFLYLWHNQTFVGYQDDTSWHAASTRARARQPHPVHRSLPLPLPLAG